MPNIPFPFFLFIFSYDHAQKQGACDMLSPDCVTHTEPKQDTGGGGTYWNFRRDKQLTARSNI